jgi:4-amino-4-deoxy-L-arabinose transferase-like glycosyltransferase
MLATDNWISPPAYDGAVPSKPPFSHWLTALASLARGEVTEVTARLPSALAFLLFIAGFFHFVAKRLSVSAAVGSGLVLIASSEWFRAVSTCRVDIILATSMAGGLLALYSWWERGYRGLPVLATLFITCATLTKGPVGFVLPIAIFSLFCWIKNELRVGAVFPIALRALALIAPVLCLSSMWYVLGYMQRGEAFIEKIMYENFQRFTSSMADEPHKHSVFYLIGMLLLGLLPWTLCGAPLIWKISRRTLPKLDAVRSWWRSLPDLYQFSFVCSLAIVFFFCIPSSKRSVYLLPAYPFVALVLERGLRRLESSLPVCFSVLEKAVMFIAGALVAIWWVLAHMPIRVVLPDTTAFWHTLGVIKVWSVVLAVALLLGPLRGVVKAMLAKPLERLAIVMVGAVVFVSFIVYDSIAWQLSPKSWVFTEKVSSHLAADRSTPMYSFGSDMYGVSFYLNRPFFRAVRGAVPAGSLAVVEAKRVDEFHREIASQTKELFRYYSGVEHAKKSLVVLKVETPLATN